MRLIDNRYKIEDMLKRGRYFDLYKVTDLWNMDKNKVIKIYNSKVENNIIDYFIDDHNYLFNIKHDSLLSWDYFGRIRTIDVKKTNMIIYYCISEYINAPSLNKILNKLKLEEILKIIIETILVVDFLHFKGITYGYLNPEDIFILSNKRIKVIDLGTISERKINRYYNPEFRHFASPDLIINEIKGEKQDDYYSIGMLIKYMLLKDYKIEDMRFAKYKDGFKLKEKEKIEITTIIEQLMGIKEITNLIDIVDRINNIFSLNYKYDIVKTREQLFFQNKIVGREKEIEKINSVDANILNGTIPNKGILFRADLGVGKTRLLNEISGRLAFKGRDIYFIEVLDDRNKDLFYISNILRQSIKDASPALIEKYGHELSTILPELKAKVVEDMVTNFNGISEIFRLCNRITNYFTELSKDKIIYIIIDDIHNMNNNDLMIIDYLITNVKGKNIFFVFSYENNHKFLDSLLDKKIKQWITNSLITEMNLYELNLQGIGEILQNILGISYIPINLASALFKEGQGNPGYIEYTIKNLYNTRELYMHKEGKWCLKADEYSDLHFPSNIEDALKKQLDIVKENYYKIFKIMSVFKNTINIKTLFYMLGLDKNNNEIKKQLDKLIGLKLIDERVDDWGYSYCISSAELKKLIYMELSNEEKIRLHSRAANAMIEYIHEGYNIIIEEILFHLEKSQQSEKALNFLLDKIYSIQNVYGSNRLFLWKKAYEIVEKDLSEIKLNILENILDIYNVRAEFKKMNYYLEEYEKDAKTLNSYNHIIKGKLMLIEIYNRMSDIDMVFKELGEIERISKENNIIEGKIISLFTKARIGIGYEDNNKNEILLNEAIELSKKTKNNKYLGTIYNLKGINNFLKGEPESAIIDYEKSIFYHEQTGNPVEITKPINNIGNIYAEYFGDLKKAMENYEKGLSIVSKFEFSQVEMIFLNNIGERYIESCEFDRAIEYIKSAGKIAMEIEDFNIIFLSNVNLGFIQLALGNTREVYKIYNYLKKSYAAKEILNKEIDTQYNSFLGQFYGFFGQWDKAIRHLEITMDICERFNPQELLKSESQILQFQFHKDGYYNKPKIDVIREKYRKIKFIQDRRMFLLNFAIISALQGDIDYAKELLEEDFLLIKSFTNNFLEEFRKLIELSISNEKGSLKKLMNLETKLVSRNIYEIGLNTNTVIGLKLFKNNLYEDALRYLIENLENIYRTVLTIPDRELQINYINSREGDLIKRKLIFAFEKVFNKELEYTTLKDIDKKGINYYFDLTPLFKVISSEELARITRVEYYDNIKNINSIEGLVSNLTGNFKGNLDLILSYMAKESLARIGHILTYDEDLKDFKPMLSIGYDSNYRINKNILDLASRNGKGIVINNNIPNIYSHQFGDILSDNVKGIICVPILKTGERVKKERRKQTIENQKILGYIYLETDKVFNKFDNLTLKNIINLSYLVFVNLENSKLELLATIDKLTDTFTRKYYEQKFEELLTDMKYNNGQFALIILDIDDFKTINDSYGHRKGDEVLRELGLILKSSVRNSDIVARYGGEEFVILLKNVNSKEALLISEKIRKNTEKMEIKGIEHPITISLGISLFPNHSQYKEELVERADQALYYAKQMGKNRVDLWNSQMGGTLNRSDKLAGILTGNMNNDNINILAIIDIIGLIKENISIEDKIFIFLGRILETINAELATIILPAEYKKGKVIFTRTRFTDSWVKTPKLNYDVIGNVIENKKGEYLIDWSNVESVDLLSGIPKWESIIVYPLIKDEDLKALIYISVPVKVKEFDFNCYNMLKTLSSIFVGIF